ncbi:class I SAM-dependent methyltransferase [Sphingomonas lenta]|uniref:Methyltransferase type 11 n=1 Tax=Sphingomonas lenta TaxID=1141887 RepID=A0A2A2SHE9_9SPHN|nr:methyltransferase domain-containing protein [Sphingomonas lenta]PAX08643.1 methyltransferase type 11 [Sphingomonas lenta]
MIPLRSPTSGQPLRADTPHSLADGWGGRWPVVDGIPFLRVEQEGLVAVALDHLDRGDPDEALVALLTNQDDWWTGPATNLDELRRLVRERDTLSLREAMALLRLGPVADYFAYRWSDPTYLAGLALLEAHWNEPRTAFELACGIGHYLREFTRRGVKCLGADVVFAKCWLAKHWVAPDADYIVFDAAATWPIGDAKFDLVQCHDAFYFMPRQEFVLERLRAAVAPTGLLAVSHIHNSRYEGGAKGPARPADEWAALFSHARVYNERALLAALVRADSPAPAGWADDPAVEAWSLVEGGGPARVVEGGIAVPPADAELRTNPLLGPDGPRWPSDRYRDEYADGCAWTDDEGDPARTRRLVDLPERW